MGHFFFGVVTGFLFSSLLYVVLLGSGYRKRTPWGLRQFLLEFAVVTVVIGSVIFIWAPSDMEWTRRYLIPIKLVQILLGIGIGVFLRFWFTRVLAVHLYPQPEQQQGNGAPPVNRIDLHVSAVPSSNGGGNPPPPGDNKGLSPQEVAIAFLIVVLIAVLLPYLEDMVRKATTLKVAGFEVSVKAEQKSQIVATLGLHRESQATIVLAVIADTELRTRLASDERRYSNAAVRTSVKAANDQYLMLYDGVLHPFISCMSELFNQGWGIETVKNDTRFLVHDLLVIAYSPRRASNFRAMIDKAAGTADRIVSKWAKVNPACKPVQRHVAKKVGANAVDSFMFHWLLAQILAFVDDRLTAIQVLEGVRDRFQDRELNWATLLARLYYDEDLTLTKSIEYYGEALRMALAALDSENRRKMIGSISCPAGPNAPAEAKETCYDVKRYEDALPRLKNDIAYAHALSDRPNLSIAREYAKEALKARIDQVSANNRSTDRAYWSRLDTYTYVTMIDSARSATPDARILACAVRTFAKLAEHAQGSFSSLMKRPNDPGFRTKFLENRYYVEIYTSHRALAAQLLERERGGECADTDELYKKMQTGDL